MSVLLSIMLVGAAPIPAPVPAMPVEPNTWFTSKDHPKTAMTVARHGPIRYTIDVAPDGMATRCETADKDDLHRKVCDLVMKNARFRPATDDQGSPAFGLYEGVAFFLIPGKDAPRRPDRARLAFTVASLPDGITAPAYARIAYLVDAAGTIGQCMSMAQEQRRSFRTVEALGPMACDRIMASHRPQPARDAAGQAVASVQSMTVKFESGSTPTP